jgi:4-amino-4-deoxy-L-arabinose transferase-like glycosyltransferase
MATVSAPVAVAEQSTALRWRLSAVVFAAFLIRLTVVICYFRQLPDADLHYEQFGWEVGWVARALASGHGFSSPVYPITGPTAMVPPLYTFLLAGIFRLFGIYTLTSGFIILSLNSLFSSLNCIAVYFSAKYSLGPRNALIAAMAWALYPFAIYFSAGRVWEYSLTSLLFTTCFCIAQRLHAADQWTAKWTVWAGFGLLYGLTAHSNPCVLSVFPFLLALALWKRRQAGLPWLGNGAAAAFAIVLALTPWTVRNYRVLHVLCPVRDDYWINIYAGNYDNTSPVNPPSNPSAHPPSNPVEMAKFLAMGEVPYLAEKHSLAAAWIRSHPAGFVRAVERRIVYYWTGYWSFRSEYLAIEPTELPNMFYVCSVTLLLALGIRRLHQVNPDALPPYLVLVLIFPLTYYLSLVLMDYRQPIEPAIVVLAVAGALPARCFAAARAQVPPESAIDGSGMEPLPEIS